jgi:hypothetical protein
MSPQFGIVTVVEYAGARWRVQRALGVEGGFLRSETGEEVSADPVNIQLPDAPVTLGTAPLPVDELRYSDANWAEATRRRDVLQALATKSSRTTADVAAAAAH